MSLNLKPDDLLIAAVRAVSAGQDCGRLFEDVPLPFYTTDAEGTVTYCNPAAAAFAGREPRPGTDRWCVTHRLYSTTGDFIPHEQCPMAEALQKKRLIRDRVAIAERPDGTRLAFRPYPTPILDEHDELVGGVNMFVDVTDEQSAELAEQANRCRRLALVTYDRCTSSALEALAEGFSKTAEDLRHGSSADPQS